MISKNVKFLVQNGNYNLEKGFRENKFFHMFQYIVTVITPDKAPANNQSV